MEKKYTFGLFALLCIAILGIGLVSAFQGFRNQLSEEDREALVSAMGSGDYETWESIKVNQISEEKFEEARARHQERAEFREALQEAREAGDREAMDELKEEFGIGKRVRIRNENLSPCPFAN